MKSIIIALALVAIVAAAPAIDNEYKPPQIIQYKFDTLPDGSYSFSYENDDGSKRQEEGKLKEVFDEENKPHTVLVVQGSYSYLGEDKKPIFVTYFADEAGYRADGDSIPKSPARK